jgi:hypothetical protein
LKQPAVLLSTALLLGVALYLGRGGGQRLVATAESPIACLDRMFLSAEKGDVDLYLSCFTGSQRQRLERELSSAGPADFAASLKSAVSGLKGRAIRGSSKITSDDDRATLTIERIYERQAYYFVRESAGWHIESVGTVEEFQPPIPYGTPAFEPKSEAGTAD